MQGYFLNLYFQHVARFGTVYVYRTRGGMKQGLRIHIVKGTSIAVWIKIKPNFASNSPRFLNPKYTGTAMVIEGINLVPIIPNSNIPFPRNFSRDNVFGAGTPNRRQRNTVEILIIMLLPRAGRICVPDMVHWV